MPDEHAGGKWYLRYKSALGHNENLELDLNFMYRVPLLPLVTADSHPIGSYQGTQVCLLDIHELAAGKLAALLSRRASRDLFDVRGLLTSALVDRERSRARSTKRRTALGNKSPSYHQTSPQNPRLLRRQGERRW